MQIIGKPGWYATRVDRLVAEVAAVWLVVLTNRRCGHHAWPIAAAPKPPASRQKFWMRMRFAG